MNWYTVCYILPIIKFTIFNHFEVFDTFCPFLLHCIYMKVIVTKQIKVHRYIDCGQTKTIFQNTVTF